MKIGVQRGWRKGCGDNMKIPSMYKEIIAKRGQSALQREAHASM